jgi:hypothetical protein
VGGERVHHAHLNGAEAASACEDKGRFRWRGMVGYGQNFWRSRYTASMKSHAAFGGIYNRRQADRIINIGCLRWPAGFARWRRSFLEVTFTKKLLDHRRQGSAAIAGMLAVVDMNTGLCPMKIPALPFTVTDWGQVTATIHPGETGQALWRTLNIGDLRVRMVEYTPGYLADHWCDRGHVLYVLEGELETELRDGRTFTLKPGMSYQVSDFGDAAHRSSTKTGAKLFIVD